MIDYLYRYEDRTYGVLNEWEEISGSYVKVEESKYRVFSETQCGYWIIIYAFDLDSKKNRKWVSKIAKKRFAYPTKIQAMISFKARKERQIKILTNQLENAKKSLVIINRWNDNLKDRVSKILTNL